MASPNSGAAIICRVEGGMEVDGRIFRVSMCFGRGLILTPAAVSIRARDALIIETVRASRGLAVLLISRAGCGEKACQRKSESVQNCFLVEKVGNHEAPLQHDSRTLPNSALNRMMVERWLVWTTLASP